MNVNGFNLQVGVYANTSPAALEIKKFLADAKKTSDLKLDIKFNSQGRQAINQVKTATGDLVTITKQYNKQEQLVDITVNKLSRDYKNLTNATQQQQQAQQNLNTTAHKSVNIFQDFTNTFLKMAKFNTINLIYDGIISKMSEAIQITNDFDKAMTEFKKVTDTSTLSLTEYSDTLGELGEATARSATQMLEAATEFSKSGYDANTSAQLAQTATLFQNIADSEISAGDAASFIISQMKAFGVEAGQATSILDKINEVSNNFAVSSTDITSALTKQSASLAAYGNTLDESIALVTAGTEIMTGQAGKVARGLRTIGANITQLAQGAKEFEIQVNGTTQSIQLWNEAGTDMLDTYSVLQQISQYWDDMTNAEQSSLAITLAKKTQMDTFLATMSNFEDAEKAYVTALTSEGSAWQENAAYMESIEAHQAELKAQWEQLVLSVPFEDLEKALLKAGTALLKFINSDLGHAIIKAAAFSSVLIGMAESLKGLYALMIAQRATSIFASAITSLIAGEATLTQVTIGLTTAMLSNPIFWGAVAVASIVGLVTWINNLTVSYEELTEALSQSVEDMQNSESTVNSLESKIKEIEEALEQLENKKLHITNEDELSVLEKQVSQLKQEEALTRSQLALEKSKLKTLQDEAKLNADKFLNKANPSFQDTSYNAYNISATKSAYDEGSKENRAGSIDEALNQEINNIQHLEERIQSLNEKLEALKKNHKENSQTAIEYATEIQELTELMHEEETSMNTHAEQLINASKAGYDFSDAQQAVLDRYTNFINETDNASDSLNQYEEEEEQAAEQAQAVSEAFEQAVKPLSDIESKYSLVSKAMKEFNEKGGMSASTIKQLAELDSKWLSVLQMKDGQLTIDKQLVDELAEADKREAIASLQAQASEDMRNVALGDLENLSPIAKQAINEIAEASTNEANAAKDAAMAHLLEAEALKYKQQIDPNGTGGKQRDDAYQMIDAIMSKYQGMIDNMNSWTLDFGDTSSSTAGSSKDAWVEAFKEEQRQLKHSLEMNEITELEYYERLKDLNEKYFGEISGNHQKYIKEYQENEEEIYKGTKAVYDKVKDYLKEAVEQGYEKAINALKKEEKAVLAEIKATIDALKREKDETLKGIKRKIDALKRQKEQVQKTYNAEIDKLKEENDTLQKQNDLLEYQQKLQQAKAQKVMVMQNGKFILSENESAVAEAQQNLSNYEDELSYEQRIEELEKLRDAEVEYLENKIEKLEEYYDYMEEYYDDRIQQMEDYYDQVQAQYEQQIELLQEELDTFKEGYQKAEDLDNARLATEVLAANEEASIWRNRLNNLAEAISEYNRLLTLIGEEGSYATSNYSGASISHSNISQISGLDTALNQVPSRASGDASFRGNEIALVGEAPNTELVLGSRLNHSLGGGSLINLSKGSGVVNAESTTTLAGLLNGLTTPNHVNNSKSSQQSFYFDKIVLPNVTSADSFVNELSQKFNNYSIQYGNIRS